MTVSSGNATVDAVGRIGIAGNVIPNSWYSAIKRPNDKPYLNAIVILAEIVYWYRPTEMRDEATGRTVGTRAKFSGDMLQRSYGSFAEQFGISKREATSALSALEDMGLVRRHLRNICVKGVTLSNVLFIEIIPERLMEVTHPGDTGAIAKSETSDVLEGEVSLQEVTPPNAGSETYTKTSRETSLETSGRDTGKRKRFTPPTLQECRDYAREKCKDVDADRFFDYYSEGGWHDAKGNPVRNWKQKMLTWSRHESPSRERATEKEPDLVKLPYGMLPSGMVKTDEEIASMMEFQRIAYYGNAKTYQRRWEESHAV